MSRIAMRYAKALYKLTGADLAKAEEQRKTLTSLKGLFEHPEASRVLRSPVMPVDLKKSLLDYGLTHAGAGEEARQLVAAVLAAGRVAYLPAVADAYAALIDEREGVARAEVAAAVPLSAEDVREIAATLGGILHKKVEIKPSVDPALLGGFVARVGNYRIDMSLRTRLDGLAQTAVQDTLR